MNTAKLVLTLSARQSVYMLSEPLQSYYYVLVSTSYNRDETYLFGSNEHGQVSNLSELPGSTKGKVSHTAALQNAGYEVIV